MNDQHILDNGPDPVYQGDITGDGVIGVNNILTLLSYFGSNTFVGQAYLENNGIVGINDMLFFLSLFGTSGLC